MSLRGKAFDAYRGGSILSQEYEVITHGKGSYHLFLVNMIYRTPHIHLDFEFLLVLRGQIEVVMQTEQMLLGEGDICIINPLQSHEFRAPSPSSPALLLSLQVPPAFYASICPEADHLEFRTRHLNNDLLKNILLQLARTHFQEEEWSELFCYSMISRFYYELTRQAEYHMEEGHSWKQAVARGNRLRRIFDYVDAHFHEKITLQDIADNLGVSTYYLSHYFKTAIGITLQEYIMRYRCEQARRLLLTTEDSTLDISLSCGFSDPKYFTRGFLKLYGMRPGEYRKSFQSEKMREQQSSMLSTQEFLSDEASRVILDHYTE